ncbi:expressed unknown protein [Seminavis robusta]|uniref:Uncharacterized protein n=1 Tax=Seminavis robusta TaxID=568900 RepID=A0A9N8E432_9STRA|nr:expressed unknown protein [Seminavis robusta]|eukprot:Sro481_g151700.1 n/a (780) ;mRNA; f:58983-61322
MSDEQARPSVDDEMVHSRNDVRTNTNRSVVRPRAPPRSMRFFRDLSASEKEEMGRHAAIILELTANESSRTTSTTTGTSGSETETSWDDDNLSEITSACPAGAFETTTTTAAMETLGEILRDCDSFVNPSENLPVAVAELVSVCQERNSRLEAAEVMIRRLQQLISGTTIVHAFATPPQPPQRSNSDPPAMYPARVPHQVSGRRQAQDPPEASEEVPVHVEEDEPQSAPPSVGVQEDNRPVTLPAVPEEAENQSDLPQINHDGQEDTSTQNQPESPAMEPETEPDEQQNMDSSPKTEMKQANLMAASAVMDDAVVQSIIEVVRQELRQELRASGAIGVDPSTVNALAEEKVKESGNNNNNDIIQRLSVAKLSQQESESTNEKEEPRKRPATRKTSDPPSVDELEQLHKSVSTLDPPAIDWKEFIIREEQNAKENDSADADELRKMKMGIAEDTEGMAATPTKPPAPQQQGKPKKTAPATVPGAVRVSEVGAFRVSPRTSTAEQSEREAREAEKTGLEAGTFIASGNSDVERGSIIVSPSAQQPPPIAARRDDESVATEQIKNQQANSNPDQAKPKDWEPTEIYLEGEEDAKPKAANNTTIRAPETASTGPFSHNIANQQTTQNRTAQANSSVLEIPERPSSGADRLGFWDRTMIDLKTDAVHDTRTRTTAAAAAPPVTEDTSVSKSLSVATVLATPVAPDHSSRNNSTIASSGNDTNTDGLLAATVALEDQNETILQLTQAVFSLQEEMRRRDETIPNAEVVPEPRDQGVGLKCQCIIL